MDGAVGGAWRRRRLRALAAVLVVHVACASAGPPRDPLTDEEFWMTIAGISEPAGTFVQPDNLVSNEAHFAELTAALAARPGAYIGVGPEQNFSYIARVRPSLAFIVDIREDNRNLHLLYKSLFEISADRADFVSRLFSRPHPAGAERSIAIDELFAALDDTHPSAALLADTTRLVRQRLVETRGFALTPVDLATIDATLRAFHDDGPDIRYGRSLPPGETRPSYRRLMAGTDHRGVLRSYLASDAAFQFVKELQTLNRVLPIVGDFAGPHAIRRIGEYLHRRSQVVTTFYASNVEVYLTRDQRRTFCGNLAALPYDAETLFVGNRRLLRVTEKLVACASIPPSLRWP
jgi:hypothetical protein